MNDEGVYRTAPATPGLFKITAIALLTFKFFYGSHNGRKVVREEC